MHNGTHRGRPKKKNISEIRPQEENPRIRKPYQGSYQGF